MIFENPVTHEILTIEKSAAGGDGEGRFRFTLPPLQGGPPRHFHREYTETFVVLEGELTMTVGDDAPRIVRAGERVTLLPGTVHSFGNTSDRPVTFRTEVDRAWGFERFIRGWYGTAIDGRSGRDGAPRSPLALAVMLDDGDVCLAGIPLRAQLAMRRALRWIAARVGVESRVAAWSARAPEPR